MDTYKNNGIPPDQNTPQENEMADNCPEINEWFYAMNGERKGPVSKDKLLNLYNAETIFLNTNVWKSGMSDWIETCPNICVISNEIFRTEPVHCQK